jgi:hypothetical protein
MNTDYVNSYAYEGFIKLAFNCSEEEHDAHYSNMLNLMRKEKNDNSVSHLSKDKLLSVVKTAIHDALYEACGQGLPKASVDILVAAQQRIEKSHSSGELLEICITGRELLLQHRESES